MKKLSTLFVPLALLGAISLAGCTRITQDQGGKLLSEHRQSVPFAQFEKCEKFFDDLQQLADDADVLDTQNVAVVNFPYLHTNRFLASFNDDPLSDQQFNFWVDQMKEVSTQTWYIQIHNLPQSENAKLDAISFVKKDSPKTSALATYHYCANTLSTIDFTAPKGKRALNYSINVPTDYRLSQRIAGLYPLSSLPLVYFVKGWQDETRETYAKPLDELPVKGQLTRYTPAKDTQLSTKQVKSILQNSKKNPLGIPKPTPKELNALFETFAPIFEVDVASNSDKIGEILWSNTHDIPIVNTQRPNVYRLVSYTRFNQQILLQLNYVTWFPERPRTSSFDLLGGYLDGIIWRVTLSPDGKPLLYDSIHNCACYHLAFPTGALKAIPPEHVTEIDTRAFVPQQAPRLAPHERIVLRIAHSTHYIDRVYTTSSISTAKSTPLYHFLSYDLLRSLPDDNNNFRSMFPEDGIVKSSLRNEWLLLWPMGVPAPGTMRQWGHHATTFVGYDYFDDPYLIQDNFVLQKTSK